MCTHLLRTLLLACSLAWFTPGEVRAEEQAPFNFDWVGSLELDTGFAAYSFELETDPSEDFLDYRGRAVVGPVVRHDLGGQRFFGITAQGVLWIREEYNKYQVNVDDVYAQVGQTDAWDLQVGRFEAWPVYHRGPGFDLFTLDDTGALKSPPFESGQFGVDMYEVNFIHQRETPGRAALHYYPTEWLSLEALGVYGKALLSNTAGGRLAVDLHTRMVRVSLGGEYRAAWPAQEQSSLQPDGQTLVCASCGQQARYGAGGGVVTTLGPVELGANYAHGFQESFSLADGQPDLPGTYMRNSVGGYAQVDPLRSLIGRSVYLGAGLNRTEILNDNNDFERHLQGAAYVLAPLGFAGASLKFVISYADLLVKEDTGDGATFFSRNNQMVAARVRLKVSY